jgi:hypothetical protein
MRVITGQGPGEHRARSRPPTRPFDRVFVVVFENKDRSDVLRVRYFAELAKRAGSSSPDSSGRRTPLLSPSTMRTIAR